MYKSYNQMFKEVVLYGVRYNVAQNQNDDNIQSVCGKVMCGMKLHIPKLQRYNHWSLGIDT